MEGQRHRRREREKKRRRNGWICLITYCTIILTIAIYLGPNLNLFFQILLLILLIILLLAGYYLSHIIFLRRKKQEFLLVKDTNKRVSDIEKGLESNFNLQNFHFFINFFIN